MSMSKLIAATLALALASAVPAVSTAAEPVKAKAEAKKKSPKAKASKSKAAKAAAAPKEADPEADEPDIAGTAVTDFNCELGNKVTVYQNATDDGHIALRWKKRLHRLTRVATTTGAQRFENKMYGLIWIGIPAKAMLLDSKQNRQLANECRNDEQNKPAPLPAPAPEAQAASATMPAPAPAPAGHAAPQG
ncbi:hypothetical protein [Pseudoduganella chitinolytica]|uniref:Exported signal peptide protein n=1 Tax=Pseudoduganella chitinolytica TaxID=34070 RepID=A0ABY8BGG1_9BURK|nr:hypothetical protein [Pseudoduganella chitinolytica]WEF33469.1 hypothetical protein PX653_01370 [Pseudoduganella chitinolytica]